MYTHRFDNSAVQFALEHADSQIKALVLRLYGTGNLCSAKRDFIEVLERATARGVVVVATTQCQTGSVMLGHYAVGAALEEVGAISAADMTLEACICKLSYLFGRGDLSNEEISRLMPVSLRGEVTPAEDLPPPPFSERFGALNVETRRRR